MTTNFDGLEDWLCRHNCYYYKPNRQEEERCRGYSLVRVLMKSRPQLISESSAEAFDPNFKKTFLLNHICQSCPFYIEDCDFTSIEPPENCLPCGGLVFISNLLKHCRIEESDIRLANLEELGDRAYISLSTKSCIKRLEETYLYHIGRDELYEINNDACDFVVKCDGSATVADLAPDREFLEFCMSEDLLNVSKSPGERQIQIAKAPEPSLRYLEWLVTYRCNLSCAHCYLGEMKNEDYNPELIRPLLNEFDQMQGLRILVSGGEPTLYEHFEILNDSLADYSIRAVLLTNGSTLNKDLVKRLRFHEVQVSLDGMEKGHTAIRGKGSFAKAVRAMELIRAAGIDLSVATMVHRFNLDEWENMKDLIESLGVKEWSVDYPCVKGRWDRHPELQVGFQEAAQRMLYAFGGSYHGTSSGWTCGRHLAAVLPSADVCKCGLFPEIQLGSVKTGLTKAWSRMPHIPISETDCLGCDQADICGGGCRFRAGSGNSRDEVMCFLLKGKI
ncbi:MAG: radical SAM protein [Deltaproteobacteria bacterium]|nr:radical SAM protein [Deltaproteobacteria bacterium]